MFTEDLATFFDTREHAVEARYNGAATIKVIFDNPFANEIGVAGTNPTALARATDLPAAAVGKTLVISGTTYRIRAREPVDDGAVVVAQLERQ